MSIKFDMYGNIIPNKMSFKPKLTDLQKEIISEFKNKHSTDLESETRTYFCKVHNRFHKYLNGSKPSQTYIKCLKSGNMYKFKDDYTQSELFHMDRKKKWTQEKANYYKE